MSGRWQPQRGKPGGRGPEPRPAAAAGRSAVRIESLLAWVAERVAKFPRDHCCTVGDRLLAHACLDVTEHLVEASYRLPSP